MPMWLLQCFCKTLEGFCGETTRFFISAGKVTDLLQTGKSVHTVRHLADVTATLYTGNL